ncbi:cell surface protein [Chaetoceros tenuissimus]|uniref:Cell surface protein n=1 Tax=Chaetoceros tenuissimus TaxID=426638 RepID=A0AAD3CT02_9STRA|nr:cell surface protein [Chaetoceros tenuissimus]
MYRGKKTLFYNGEKLYDEETGEYLVYDQEEQNSWEVIIVSPGVEVIPEYNFCGCYNLDKVVISDSVKRIERMTFAGCESLFFVGLSTSLEYIGESAFCDCACSLISIFIPPSCRHIGEGAFADCHNLIIFHVPQQTQIGENAIGKTALIKVSPLEVDGFGRYYGTITESVNAWIKNINGDDDRSK